MRTKKNDVRIKKSGYIDSSCYNDYLADLELLTNQKIIEQQSELKRLSIKIKNLIDSKFNGNKKDAIKFYKLNNNIG